jgi:hypothetical protein
MSGSQQYSGMSHYFGNDASVSASGDLLTSTGNILANQRILRRLMTNPGSMLYHPEYGGGLGLFVGKVANAQVIKATILAQMQLEASVDQTTTPTVQVQVTTNGYVYVAVAYIYALTGEASSLSFKVTN